MPEDITFELVNDKAELENALETLSHTSEHYWSIHSHCDTSGTEEQAIDTLLELVPRLMASYEQALELTYTLADAWESYMDNQTPAGIYVP